MEECIPLNDKRIMQEAVNAAISVKGGTYPNPPVGAVLVRDGRIIAVGATDPAGGPHAEVNCLEDAGDLSNGADLYVTLEPCSHYGKTPPCTDLILKRGVKRVVIACTDPNPLVCGRGIRKLQEGGVEVVTGVLEDAVTALLYRPFFHYIKTGKPYVIVKYAMSIDGKIAFYGDARSRISGKEAFEHVHILRKECDAVLVGAGTVRKDNPSLNCRIPGIPDRFQPAAVVVSGKGIAGDGYTVLQRTDTILAVTTESNIENTLPFDGTVDDLLLKLGERGVVCMLVEGGKEILTQFTASRNIQEFHIIVAPGIIGGGLSPIGHLESNTEKSIIGLQGGWKPLGQDMLFIGEFGEG